MASWVLDGSWSALARKCEFWVKVNQSLSACKRSIDVGWISAAVVLREVLTLSESVEGRGVVKGWV